ncbi:GCN5 family acetyltransferase [Bacillus manliponensis]|uniref:GCN5 family acetyltransferase n=1 Tax=Bacillus manliponensis TaxID=574376 RepID=A0A073JZ47_9BACI|nr:GNAT family N-acetyltransferase [Bacillus manliponensis]KEK19447.1 GCN5 family acetyltransferase [Bacillus manliponensis]
MIREITEQDAATFLTLCQAIDGETDFMLFERNERKLTIEKQITIIQTFLSSPNSSIFVAEKDNELVGYILARGGTVQRNKHSVYLAIGILQDYAGQGIGKQLFHTVEEWAREHEILRLELKVMAHNERAISLYKKCGFNVEGEAVHGVIVNGEPKNEYYMAKLL